MKKLFGFLLVVGLISTAFVTKKDTGSVGSVKKGGIEFKKMTFEEALREAEETNKLIFIDAYTEWCGPCKLMAKTSFLDPKVAELYNAKFINLKVEMEKDADGPMIARAYKVAAYPTLLFIDGQGKVVKEMLGYQNADQLKAVAKSLP